MPLHLTRDLRNALRGLVTAHNLWPHWRATYLKNAEGTARDASAMTRDEILLAAYDCGIDVLAIAADHGQSLTSEDLELIVAAIRTKAPFPATTANKDTLDMVATPATTPDAIQPAHALEGRDPQEVIREALAPAEGMVGQKLLDMLAASVAPLAAAAVAGPRTVHVTRTVTVRAPGEAGDGAQARVCNVTGDKPAREAFGLKAADAAGWREVLDKPVTLWDGTVSEGVPAVDPWHVWDVEALAYMCIASRFADDNSALRNLSRVLMFGPAGTGKTSTAQQFAAVTGRPFVRVAFDRSMEAAELIGQRLPKAGGGTVFHEGALVAAMQVPGCVILLDEPSFLRPGVAAVLQTILDTGCVYLKEDGNRRVDMAPGVIVCAADNTNLTGDETGRYADTMAQNIALQDRFAYLVPLDYLPETREAQVLHNRTGVNLEAARAMVAFASTTRKGAATGQLTAGCSLRRLVAWATGCVAGVPSAVAFKAAVFNAADAADRETIRGLEKNAADHARIDALVRGAPMPQHVTPGTTSTAKGAAAAGVFAAQPVTA